MDNDELPDTNSADASVALLGDEAVRPEEVHGTSAADDENDAPHPVAPAGGRLARVTRRLGRILAVAWRVLFTVTLVTVCAVGALVAYGSTTGKFRVTTMLTGSMANVLPVGSLVVVQPHPAQDLEVDDIIAFVPPESEDTTIHRVTEILEWDPQPVVVTKGDMNNAEDPWTPMRIEQTEVWQPGLVIPRVGEGLLWLQDTKNRLMAAGTVALVLWLRLMWGIWRSDEDEDDFEEALDDAPAPHGGDPEGDDSPADGIITESGSDTHAEPGPSAPGAPAEEAGAAGAHSGAP
jgi:signal peptidase I